MTSGSPRLLRPWAIFFGLFLVLIVILADVGDLGWLKRIYDFPLGDKLGHFTLFGLLSLLINLSLFQDHPGWDRRRTALVAGLAIIVLIGLEEISQNWFATRSADVFDWLAGSLGVILFAGLAVWIKRKRG